jgi:hypothetical protein
MRVLENFPERVPIVTAASFLTQKWGITITSDFLLELKFEGKIKLRRHGLTALMWIDLMKLQHIDQRNEYRTNWYISKSDLIALAQNESGLISSPDEKKKPVQRMLLQEEIILDAIRSAGFDPKSFPQGKKGKKGEKSAIRVQLLESHPSIFANQRIFDKAWERLRAEGLIADAPPQ